VPVRAVVPLIIIISSSKIIQFSLTTLIEHYQPERILLVHVCLNLKKENLKKLSRSIYKKDKQVSQFRFYRAALDITFSATGTQHIACLMSHITVGTL
jgi:hypothetical protein